MTHGGSRDNHQLETGTNIVDLLERDHEKLKELARVLRDTSARPKAKLSSAKEFFKLFSKHSKFELKVLYSALKGERSLRAMVIEGEVEHGILDKKISHLARKLAEVQKLDEALTEELRVLGEVVLHHLKEEEEELFFYMKKELPSKKLGEMGLNFLSLCSSRDSDTYRPSQVS